MAISCRCGPMPRSQGDLDGNGSPWGEARQPRAPAQRHSADGSARLRRLDRSGETLPLQLATFGGEKLSATLGATGFRISGDTPLGEKLPWRVSCVARTMCLPGACPETSCRG